MPRISLKRLVALCFACLLCCASALILHCLDRGLYPSWDAATPISVALAERLGMPHQVLDCRTCFRERVIRPFAAAYEAGCTPNPCVDCNREIKFGALLDWALDQGADAMATGHYARVRLDTPSGRWQLLRGADRRKDQTYFLYQLTQHQLAHLLLPVGDYEKPALRALAAANGLSNAQKADSQDICFVPDGDYVSFLRQYGGVEPVPGDFLDSEGRVLGRHRGMECYTIGQRKGLGIPSNQPLYVKAIDPKSNQVVLSENDALFSQQLTGENFNWIAWEAPPRQFRCSAKIRYRQTEQPCEVTVEEDGSVQVLFDRPQRAITPGQAVVLYDGDTVLGGGTIL